jgi:hypothetical protein
MLNPFLNDLAPEIVRGLFCFSIYISSIAVWTYLTCQLDLLLFVRVRWFLGLTCDFWAKNAKNKLGVKQRQWNQPL